MAWRPARSIVVLRTQINNMFPTRPKASDGMLGDTAHSSRTSDHNPNSAGVVCAVDITATTWTQSVVNALVASRDRRIKYIIWNRRICSGAAGPAPWVWRAYSGTNPHTKHFHLSVLYPTGDTTTSLWRITSGAPKAKDDEVVSTAQEEAIAIKAAKHVWNRYTVSTPEGKELNLQDALERILRELAELKEEPTP